MTTLNTFQLNLFYWRANGRTPRPGSVTIHTPTLAQLVESAYAWGNGDLEPGDVLDVEQLTTPECNDQGDSLLAFLQREVGEADDLETAVQRIETISQEIESVREALGQALDDQEVAP